MSLDGFEWATLFLYIVAWHIPILIAMYTSIQSMLSHTTDKKNITDRYNGFKTFLPKLIPSWTLGILWGLLYASIAVSTWLYLNWSKTEMHSKYSTYYDAVNGLVLVNYILNLLITPIFFGFSWYWIGSIISLLIFITSLVIEILMWIHSGLSAYIVSGCIVFIFYVILSGYTFILSLDIAMNNKGNNIFSCINNSSLPTTITKGAPKSLSSRGHQDKNSEENYTYMESEYLGKIKRYEERASGEFARDLSHISSKNVFSITEEEDGYEKQLAENGRSKMFQKCVNNGLEIPQRTKKTRHKFLK